MKSKMKFVWLGVNFELPSECLRTADYWGKKLDNPYISIGRKEVPLLFKQFAKAKYPDVLVWGKSSTFANGCSSDLYACNADGTELSYSSKVFNDLNSFSNMMQGGRYDGQFEIYEYSEPGKTDNGTTLEFSSKYVHFNPKAPFASWPDCRRMLIDMMEGKYVWGKLSLEQSIEKVKSYKVKESDIQKALQSL
jgi:hypothetical protein